MLEPSSKPLVHQLVQQTFDAQHGQPRDGVAAAHGAESPSATSTTASNGRQLRHNNERHDGALWQQWTTADLVSSGLPCTPEESVRRRMSLFWGVESFVVDRVTHTDQMVAQVDEALKSTGRAENGDKVIIISGSPPGIPGTTNDIRVHKVGDVL